MQHLVKKLYSRKKSLVYEKETFRLNNYNSKLLFITNICHY